jgi:dsDNA-binding SOS-regulon protein
MPMGRRHVSPSSLGCCLEFLVIRDSLSVRWMLLLWAALLGSSRAADEVPTFTAEQLEHFEKQVRPILVNRCYECHSGSSEEVKGNLRLDSREFSLQGGDSGPAFEPGNAKESLLIDAINYGDVYQMPPKSRMPAEEVAILTKWIDDGAPWPTSDRPVASDANKGFDLAARKAAHWSWRPLAAPPLPTVKNTAWPADGIDHFILARLEAAGFAPAPAADKRALLRRVHFDLTGLPPTAAQIDAFLRDESPEALAKAIDGLLESSHFGERWGRHWLDLMRYADSRGHEFDYNAANAYQYRDYVIRALNADVPYNQFVTEHVAGDLVPQPRLNPEQGFNESILGTGFWFLGEWVHSPVDIRKDEADRYDNMLDVFSKTFLGLTVSCARCHDHKFDAISTKDYYALAGYLQSSAYRLARFDTMQEEERIARALAELNARFEPELKHAMVESQRASSAQITSYLLAAREGIQGNLAENAIPALATQRNLEAARLAAWIAQLREAAKQPHDALHLWAKFSEAKGPDELDLFKSIAEPLFQQRKEQQAAFERALAASETIVDYSNPTAPWIQNGVTFGVRPVAVGQLLFSSDPAQPVLGFAPRGAAHRDPTWNGLQAAPGSERDVAKLGNIDRAGKTLRTPTFTLTSGKLHYLVRGQGHAYAAVDSHSVLAGPLHNHLVVDFDKGETGLRWVTHDLPTYADHRVHVEFSPAGDQPLEILRVVQAEQAPPLPVPDELQELDAAVMPATSVDAIALQLQQVLQRNAAWLWQHRDLVPAEEAKTHDLFARYAAERKQLTDQIKPHSRYAMAMWDGSGEDERLMIRGSHKNLGPAVPRRMLEAIAGSDAAEIESGSGRLQLAHDLVDPAKNPFPTRVFVNRVWHQLFGRGLVASVDNFGVLGQEPTHPELLDHLATRLIEEGWSVKRLIRSIMLSRTYQMASTISDSQAEEADPKNLLWRRTNIRRLQAESIRDSLLALSGRLDHALYGPSVPVHLTAFMQGRGRPAEGPLDGAGRRSIYLSVRRNFLAPMMLAFDAPIPFSTMGARNVSNVPAQALILMNDPFVVQQAELWAQHVLAEPNLTPQQRIDRMYVAAYARSASDGEIAAALEFLADQAAEYGLPAEAAAHDARLWTDLGHVLINAKEFIFLN